MRFLNLFLVSVLVFAAFTGSSAIAIRNLSVAEVKRTQVVGGYGGTSFDDSHVPGDFGRISYIKVNTGRFVDFLGIGYTSGKFIGHGGSGGNRHDVIRLSEGEFINRVSGRYGRKIDQITFTTQKGKKYGPYGGGGGKKFDFNFGDKALLYLFGRSASEVDQLGFGYSKPVKAEFPTWVSPAYGRNGGLPFNDFRESKGSLGKITKIKIRAAKFVDSIETCYKNSDCYKHGGNGGKEHTFKLNNDEYITEIHGRAGKHIDSISFVLNTGRVSPVYGGGRGAPFTIKKDNHVVKHFFGRSARLLDQFGAFFTEATPTRIEIIDLAYDLSKSTLHANPRSVTTKILNNNSTVTQTIKHKVKFKVSETQSTFLEETHGADIQLKFTKEFGTLVSRGSLEVSVGYSYSQTVNTGQSITREKEDGYTIETDVGPGKRVRATVIVKEGVFTVPWEAKARLFYSNSATYTETTIRGKLTGVALSEAEAIYTEV